MTDLTLPSGAVFDFGDLSKQEIANSLTELRSSNPELFMEPNVESRGIDYSTATSEEIEKYFAEKSSGEIGPSFTPTVEGQVTSASDRYGFGQADTVAEEEKFLTDTYGPNSFGKDNRGRYYLNLDNISPEIKQEKKLPESGTMWFNKPGGGFLGLFDMPDVVEFVGKYRGELVGGTAAALATTGVGLIPASLLIGLGAGAGKGLDELQEYAEGRQLQEPKEIYGDVATAAAFNSLGNVVVGGALKGIGKLIRGPGNPDAQVITDLMAANPNLSESAAKAIAVQMQRTATRAAVKEGARPTVSEATGKAVLGRLQAIHEGIFPNRTAARSNRKYVEDLIKQYKSGELSDDAFGAALDKNARDVSSLITSAMKDPDEAVRLANQQLRDVIEQEMNLLKQVYTTGDETAAAFQNEMTRMVRLWQNNSQVLYNNADDILGKARLFKVDDLQKVVKRQLEAPLAAEQGLRNNPVYQYILNKTDDFTIGELQALRSTIQNSRSGSLVGDVTDNQLKGLSDKLDEMFSGAEFRMNEIIQEARTGNLTYEVLSQIGPREFQMGFRVGPEEVLNTADAKRIAKQFAEGLDKFKAANRNYQEGAKVFKTGAMNMLNQNIKEGFFADLSAVVETVVVNNRPEALRNYLKGVTPSPTVRGAMQSIPETQWSEMANAARQGNITELNRLLGENFPQLKGGMVGREAEKVLKDIGLGLRPPEFLERLPVDDPFRQRILGELAETLQLHADDAAAAAAGTAHRDVTRQALASTWIKTNVDRNVAQNDIFDPVAFRRSFESLGKEVQDVLFGQTEARRLGRVLKDFSLVAPDQIRGGFRFGSVAPESITNSNMRNIVQNLQADVATAQSQSSSALFQAVKTGRIDDAEALIQAAVKDPKLLDDLIREVPDYTLDQPFGLKDAVMSRIVRESFPKGITEEAVVSGAWKDGMAASIANLNQRGALNKILGRDVVQDLVKITKLPVGDQALKGKGGLASSTYAAGIGLALITNPATAIPSLAGIYLSGRILRSPLFLNLVTRPNIRAGELKKGIKALSDDIIAKARADGVNVTRKQATDEAKKQLGDLSVLRLRFKQLIGSEARLLGATAASGSVDADTRRSIGEGVSQAAEAAGPAVQQLQQQASNLASSGQVDALRQMELNKLLGMTP